MKICGPDTYRHDCAENTFSAREYYLRDDDVADLADEHDQARRAVVVLRVLPDQQDRVHDRAEEVVQGLEVHGLARELDELVRQRVQELHGVVRLLAALLHL